MATHSIEPTRAHLHGHFSAALPPILTIEPGDTVRFRTLDAGWRLEPPRLDGSSPRMLEPRDDKLDAGHALCGPLAIRGARPGMALEIRMDAIEPEAWGWTRSGGWKSPINDRLGVADGAGHWLIWTIDAARKVARDQHGHEVSLRPFMGVMGLAPAERGVHSTIPPRASGGNIDCKELVAGSTLFLPIAVNDALFSVGDGHATQGDGEVSGLAIECPMRRVELTFALRDDLGLRLPMAETPAGTVTLGFGATLDDAAGDALDAMVHVIGARFGVSRKDALALASVAVDLRVTQVVNQVVGVHAVLPPDAIRGGAPRRA
ncbi:MAG TPA: acetamidase/formamidase family protein [Candidatus Sulfotelmatobacter sp.]|nr:acetamidase/formamidase family protein [Candidatus Sulfotelmatobacter sp.]